MHEIQPSNPVEAKKMQLFPLDTPLSYQYVIENSTFFGGVTLGNYFSNKLGTLFVEGEDLLDRDTSGRPVTEGRSMEELKSLLHGTKTTDFGKKYVTAVAGKRFIDLASGEPEIAVLTRRLAQAAGAKEYIGIDKYLDKEEVRTDEFPTTDGNHFTSTYLQTDMLTAVSQMKPEYGGTVFFLSGIQPVEGGEKYQLAVKYLDTMMEEIQRVTHTGDVMIVGLTANEIKPEEYGFRLQKLVERDDPGGSYRLCGIYVREKE